MELSLEVKLNILPVKINRPTYSSHYGYSYSDLWIWFYSVHFYVILYLHESIEHHFNYDKWYILFIFNLFM